MVTPAPLDAQVGSQPGAGRGALAWLELDQGRHPGPACAGETCRSWGPCGPKQCPSVHLRGPAGGGAHAARVVQGRERTSNTAVTVDTKPQSGESPQKQDWGCPGLRLRCPLTGLGVCSQAAAPGDGDEDEDDEDFVEVPEKEGYEACISEHLQPECGEWPGWGRAEVPRRTLPFGADLTSGLGPAKQGAGRGRHPESVPPGPAVHCVPARRPGGAAFIENHVILIS